MLHSLVFPLTQPALTPFPGVWAEVPELDHKREFSLAKPQQELSLTATEDCCLLPMVQVHRAGEGGSCSNQAVRHEELEESSQRNGFAHFCFGFVCECFLSALVDEFQTEEMSGNEREKAVTHCTMCQGAAVTHSSWQDPGVHLTFAAPTGAATLTLALPAHPQLQLQLLCSLSLSSWGRPLLPHTPAWHWPGQAKGTCRGVVAETSAHRAGQEVAGKLPGGGSCPAQLVLRATGRLQILAMAQEGKVPQDHAESRGTSLLLPPYGSLPGASDMRP